MNDTNILGGYSLFILKTNQKSIFDHDIYLPAHKVEALESHICQKTLHNFRVLVITNEKAQEIFSNITDNIITNAGLSTEKQRLDSKHIISNMANLSLLQLFVRTIEGFLNQLEKSHPGLYKNLPSLYEKVYRKRSGYFADVKSSRAKRRLAKCARHLFDLVDRFRGHREISHMKLYQLMVRLLEEQCEIAQGDSPKVILKDPKDISSQSLQNPSDPDATYGRKGKGYKVSITETCVEYNPFQVVEAIFSAESCNACEFKAICLVKRHKKGKYRLRYKRKDMATSRRREEQDSSDFKERYKIRSGIEATISEADRVTGLKKSWTRGKVRVTMSVFMKALAINIKRYIQNEMEKAARGHFSSTEPIFALGYTLITFLISIFYRRFTPRTETSTI